MKISKITKLTGYSRNTIQYYTCIGLLMPLQKGADHDYTQREVDDLAYIEKLKAMSFSIKDIQAIIRLKRLSNWHEPATRESFKTLLDSQKNKVQERIINLEKALQCIEEEKENLLKIQDRPIRLGIPISAVGLLACPHCHNSLHLSNAEITYPYIFNGQLSCECGYQAAIIDGIIDTGNRYGGFHDSPDLDRHLYEGMPDEFYKYFHKIADSHVQTLNHMDLSGKVVMENRVNGYFFLYNHFKDLNNDCTYIITDKYLEIIQAYKERIERLGLPLNMVMIADNSMKFPLREKSVDVMISFFAGGEHQLYEEKSLAEEMQPYFKKMHQILGADICYERNSQSIKALHHKYPEGSCLTFIDGYTEKNLTSLGYKVNTQKLGTLYDTPDVFAFEAHKTGEPLYMEYYFSTRS